MWTDDWKPDGPEGTLIVECILSPREALEDAGCDDIPMRVSLDVDDAKKSGVGIEVSPELSVVPGPLLGSRER